MVKIGFQERFEKNGTIPPIVKIRWSTHFVTALPSRQLLEYVRGLLGLGWLYSPLVLGLIRDKGRLLKGQVSLAWESSKN